MLGEDFRTYLEVEKNYSEHTVKAYVRDLKSFREFIQTAYEFDPLAPEELDGPTHRMIRAWMGDLMDSGISKRSVARKVASLNSWFRWLQKTGRLETNPAKKVSVPKYDKKLPTFLQKDSIETLFQGIEYPEGFPGARDRALLEVLYSCGLRRSEIIGLQFSNINFPDRTLKVMGKGRKERVIPFGRAAESSMRLYMQEADNEGLSYREHFFVKKDGNKLYPKRVHQIVETYLKQASTLSKTSPHVLRHSFATHLLDNGADLNAIKEMLGHSSLAATQVYLHNSISKLKKVYDQAHPKA